MLNLKKTAVAVLALGSSAVFAGSMGPVCSAVNVTVPCEATAWDFAGKALYLKAETGNNTGFNMASDTTSAIDHAPNYNWGFQLEGSYHFNTGNDLNLNWYHLSHKSSAVVGALPATSFFTVAGVEQITTVTSASLETNPKWDAVNMEFGQHVDFGDNKAIRFHGGAQWARVANDVDFASVSDFTAATTTATGISQITDYHHTYNGFGPRLGMDMTYDWGNGLGIYANGATAILAGTRAHDFDYSDNLGNAGISVDMSRTAVVPVIDAKLGATYTYAMAQGDLTLDAGWMWINYFSARSNAAGDTSDFALQGPFVGLKWLGNVA